MIDPDADPRVPQDARRYRIVGVLGRGGFGTVYLARMEGADGFVKDVAIKILSNPDPPTDVLTRFRDEARILGRLRDRNIVSVDPPIRLNDRWAVVMEFVEGMDCRRLLKIYERIPPLVSLGIVEEVARTLDNLWHHAGDEGQPMHLLHRDLKPGNLQLTPTGNVKLLDFGVAKATLKARETETTHHIGGTIGYIAPERLDGVEDHPGDVYSLGVVLEELITGTRPSRPGDDQPLPETEDEALLEAMRLARAMRLAEPSERPTAAEVEQRCRDLLRRLDGTTLRHWARDHVQARPDTAEDPLVGRTLSETLSRVSREGLTVAQPLPRKRGWAPILALLLGAAVVAVVLFLAGGLGGAGAGILLLRSLVQPGSVVEVPVEVPTPIEVPEAAPEPIEPVEEEPVEEEPTDEPPAEAPAGPRPQTPARTGTVSIDGDADLVELLGEAGTFPPGPVPPGSYTVRATFGGRTVTAGTVAVEAGGAVGLRCDGRFKRCMPR